MGTDLAVRMPRIPKRNKRRPQAQEGGSKVGKTTLLKRKHQDPLPSLRWLGIARNILEHIIWRREWVTKDRLNFIRQFTREGIKFFVKEGLEEWREPFAKKRRGNREGPLAGWLAGSEPETLLTGVGPARRREIRQELEILQQATDQELRLI